MRDDVWNLPLPKEAKQYARRKGLKSMMRQPKDFARVNAKLMNPGKPNVLKNYTVGQDTAGGQQKHAIKDSAKRIVNRLLA